MTGQETQSLAHTPAGEEPSSAGRVQVVIRVLWST